MDGLGEAVKLLMHTILALTRVDHRLDLASRLRLGLLLWPSEQRQMAASLAPLLGIILLVSNPL